MDNGNLTLNVLEKMYHDLQELAPKVGFDKLHANRSTILRMEREHPDLREYEIGSLGVKVIERESMPDGYVAIQSGDKIIGIIDLNKGTIATTKPLFA